MYDPKADRIGAEEEAKEEYSRHSKYNPKDYQGEAENLLLNHGQREDLWVMAWHSDVRGRYILKMSTNPEYNLLLVWRNLKGDLFTHTHMMRKHKPVYNTQGMHVGIAIGE